MAVRTPMDISSVRKVHLTRGMRAVVMAFTSSSSTPSISTATSLITSACIPTPCDDQTLAFPSDAAS